MIDATMMMRTLDDLTATFGTGDLAAAGLDTGLPQSAALARAAGELGYGAAAHVAPHWSGGTATLASGTTAEVAAVSEALGQRGASMGLNLLDAATTVLQGVSELAAIAASFLGVLKNADTLLASPIGQLTLLKAALDHLSPAIGVVIRVSTELSGHTAQMQALSGGLALPATPLAPGVPPMPPTPEAATLGSATLASYGSFDGHVAGGVQVVLPDGSVATAPNAQAADAVRNALSQQGVPYMWGGTTPGAGFDCSGLVQWSYGQAGVDLPRMAHEQSVGVRVDPSQVQPGDLAIWSGHAAMVIGNGQMVEATGDPVTVNPIRTENGSQQFLGFYRPTGGAVAT